MFIIYYNRGVKMKKNVLFLLVILTCFILLPNNVDAKVFKQVNQTGREQSSNQINHTESYKLDNGDYLISASKYITRITNEGTVVWTYDTNQVDNDMVILGDYVYIGSRSESLKKIKLSDGTLVKKEKNIKPDELAACGNSIIAIVDDNVYEINQDLTVVKEYSDNSLDSNQYSYFLNVVSDDSYIYVINVIETVLEPTGEANISSSVFESKIIKLDKNLIKVTTMPINEYYLNQHNYGETFFTDNSGNLYIVDDYILKINSDGTSRLLYNPYGESDRNAKVYQSGTIVDNYLVVGGLYYDNSGKKIIGPMDEYTGIPIVDIYDANNNMVEEHELKTDGSNAYSFDVYNINTTSTDGFIVKWISRRSGSVSAAEFPGSYSNMINAQVVNKIRPSSINSLNITEFSRIRNVKLNVKGSGSVKVSSTDCVCGEVVKLTIEQKEGYYLKSLVVRDINGNKLKVKDNQFVMPCDGDVTIDAQFREIINPETSSILIIAILLVTIIIGSTMLVRKKSVQNN